MGTGSLCFTDTLDADGNALDGAKAYKVHLPPIMASKV